MTGFFRTQNLSIYQKRRCVMNDTAYQDDKPINQRQVKSKKRVADFGEVFTNEREVKAMLDLLPPEIWHKITATFLEPACGNGNFLAQILSRKLDAVLQSLSAKKIPKKSQAFNYGYYAIYAVSSIYGIEILADNCTECHERLLALFIAHYQKNFKKTDPQVIKVVQYLLSKNIVNHDALFNKDNPIIFSEWKFMGEMVTRRDFVYGELVKDEQLSKTDKYRFKNELLNFYDPIHFLKIYEQG